MKAIWIPFECFVIERKPSLNSNKLRRCEEMDTFPGIFLTEIIYLLSKQWPRERSAALAGGVLFWKVSVTIEWQSQTDSKPILKH